MTEIAADEPRTDRELLLDVHRDVKALLKSRNDHEDRIRSLEQNRYTIAGIAICLSLFITTFGYCILNKVF